MTNFLEELSKDFAPSVQWRAAKEMLVGKFLSATVANTGSDYGPSVVVTFEAMEGSTVKTTDNKKLMAGTEYSLWLFYEALENQFVDQAPQAGENFGVLYSGKQLSKNAKQDASLENDGYHHFRMKVDRQASNVWDAMRAKKTGNTPE